MRRWLPNSAVLATMAPAAHADMKIGVLMGFTGPIESLTPNIARAAELAMEGASDSGTFLGGRLKLLAAGRQVDYQGATDVELTPVGDTSSPYKECEIRDGTFTVVGIH